MTLYETLAGMVPDAGDRATTPFGDFAVVSNPGVAATRYLHLYRHIDAIEVALFDSTIAVVRPDSTRLWAHGYGDRATTRAALTWLARHDGLHVHSHKRLLWLSHGWGPGSIQHEFREGIAYNPATFEIIDPGDGEQVVGAPARRRAS